MLFPVTLAEDGTRIDIDSDEVEGIGIDETGVNLLHSVLAMKDGRVYFVRERPLELLRILRNCHTPECFDKDTSESPPWEES